jgi:hypothetical protein
MKKALFTFAILNAAFVVDNLIAGNYGYAAFNAFAAAACLTAAMATP